MSAWSKAAARVQDALLPNGIRDRAAYEPTIAVRSPRALSLSETAGLAAAGREVMVLCRLYRQWRSRAREGGLRREPLGQEGGTGPVPPGRGRAGFRCGRGWRTRSHEAELV